MIASAWDTNVLYTSDEINNMIMGADDDVLNFEML